MVNNLKEIISHSMAFIQDDFTELWVIVNKIHNENPKMNFPELIEATKAVVKELVENYSVYLLDEETQKPLFLNSTEVLNILEKRLKKLNRIPNIGDGIWFTV